jgi:predicted dehydrogenase
LAREAVGERPSLVLVEKPLCPPDCQGMLELQKEAGRAGVKVCVGYDHVVAKSIAYIEELLAKNTIGDVVTLDVEFREHWGGIFKAHPWLSGPWETYLGYWKRGGGAGGEHSHAVNLWQHLARRAGKGSITKLNALVEFQKERDAEYDAIFSLHVKTEEGFYGRIIQDVVTQPTRKWARVQGSNGAIEWHANQGDKGDVVQLLRLDGKVEEFSFPKTRADDFIREMEHIDSVLLGRLPNNSIGLEQGIDTMRVLAAGYQASSANNWMDVKL